MSLAPPRRYQLEYERTRPLLLPVSAYNFPLHSPRDYAQMTAAHESEQSAPVLLNHEQYFSFLSQLTDALRAALGDRARFFVEVRTPYVGSLPENLLRPDVLLGANLMQEAASAAEGSQGPVVWVGDRIRRDLDYHADNSLRCAVWPASHSPAVDAILARSWPEYAIKIVRIA